MTRTSGILLHPTSLPGKQGIGDLGNQAYRFADFLKNSGQHLWQMLPLGPTGYGNSPYQCHSAFAGNPLLINLEKLLEDGFLDLADLKNAPPFPEHKVDFDMVSNFKIPLLQKAFTMFKEKARPEQKEDFENFCSENAEWLNTFATFMAIKEANNLGAWNTWEISIRKYRYCVLKELRNKLGPQIHYHEFQQYLFFKQWTDLKIYCKKNDIRLIGDMPVFLAMDSAEVWSRPDMFYIDEREQPTIVAGVPPDYFSKTGQLWGNPLYRWDVIKKENYYWWVERLRAMLDLFDIIRIDHFRGFEKFWAIPAGDKTAENGQWLSGPSAELFETLRKELGVLPIIAEDLGIITPEVEALRDRFDLPGMRVLQFAFRGDPKKNIHLPHLHRYNCIVYTGTHDNSPITGWFRGEDIRETTQSPEERQEETSRALKYLGTDGHDINWDFIRLAFDSVADMVIIPLQDVMGLGNEARMNTPGTVIGNWRWRFCEDMLTREMGQRLKEIAWLSGR